MPRYDADTASDDPILSFSGEFVLLVLDAVSTVVAFLIVRVLVREGFETIGYRFTIQSSKRSFEYFS
jgi:hypothetical protein